jgi:hypothetical protein
MSDTNSNFDSGEQVTNNTRDDRFFVTVVIRLGTILLVSVGLMQLALVGDSLSTLLIGFTLGLLQDLLGINDKIKRRW